MAGQLRAAGTSRPVAPFRRRLPPRAHRGGFWPNGAGRAGGRGRGYPPGRARAAVCLLPANLA